MMCVTGFLARGVRSASFFGEPASGCREKVLATVCGSIVDRKEWIEVTIVME